MISAMKTTTRTSHARRRGSGSAGETINELCCLLAILLAGGIEPQTAAWAIDSLFLYVSAYALERSLLAQRQKSQDHEWVLSRDELVSRFEALPADRFPQIRRHAAELTAGVGHDRFDFALGLIIDNLEPRRPR
jgi:hypothetical protein